jgi:hypothetical protein
MALVATDGVSSAKEHFLRCLFVAVNPAVRPSGPVLTTIHFQTSFAKHMSHYIQCVVSEFAAKARRIFDRNSWLHLQVVPQAT